MNITYRPMRSGEETAVCRLVNDCFSQFVAPDYSEAGVNEFLMYSNSEALKQRSQKEHFVLVALDGDKLVGVIEVRSNNHICLLFVQTGYQNIGVARQLLNLSVESCKRANPLLQFIDVHSSPYAVRFYKKLGFFSTTGEQETNGIRFTPMKLSVA